MGNLYTVEKFRRRGLAHQVVAALARLHHNLGLIPSAYIEDYNDASRALFRSVGFKKEFDAAWVGFNPIGCSTTVKKMCCV